MADIQAGPSAVPETRTSGRVRQKSARQLESEQSQRLLAAARKAEAVADGAAPLEAAKTRTKAKAAPSKAPTAKTNKGKGRAAGKGAAGDDADGGDEADFCVCKREKEGPMIECAECNDWFHFDCVGLDDEDAAEIDTYICETCEGRTGKTTSLLGPSGEKRKTQFGNQPGSRASSLASHSGSDAANAHADGYASDSSSASIRTAGPRKRVRLTASPAPVRSPTLALKVKVSAPPRKPQRKASGTVPVPAPKRTASSSTGTGADLPPARQYVVDKLGEVVGLLFTGRPEAVDSKAYARDMEAALFASFKDVVGGKEIAGVRYKAQFNLLASSLNASLRPELLATIWSRALAPAQVAVLAAAELASAARLAELEQARQASLQQTVKAKEEVAGVRVGRDGFERVEDTRANELRTLEREEARRRDSTEVGARVSAGAGAGADDADNVIDVGQSPATELPGPAPRKSSSAAAPAVPSPAKRNSSETLLGPGLSATQFALSSAWGAPADTVSDAHDDAPVRLAGDQDVLDLSDIVADDAYDDDLSKAHGEAPAAKTDMDVFMERPVAWSGTLGTPDTSPPPPVTLRFVSGRAPFPAAQVARLLPAPKLEIIGRVPTADSNKFLRERRFDAKLDVVVGAFGLRPGARDDERKAWDDMVAFYVNRDRHGLCWPHGKRAVPGTAKELYLIPLRPGDALPEIVGLVEHCAVPAARADTLFLGVFLVSKDVAPAQPAATPIPPVGYTPLGGGGGGHTPQSAGGYTPGAAAYTGGATPPAVPVPAPAPAPGLQALLANLDIPTILAKSAAAPPQPHGMPPPPAVPPGVPSPHGHGPSGPHPPMPMGEPYGWQAGPRPPPGPPMLGSGTHGMPPGPGAHGLWGI
ncbi:hypothetical protein Q5752_003081 [Cryptotrichosporon argae]